MTSSPSDLAVGDDVAVKAPPSFGQPTTVYDINTMDGIEDATLKAVDARHGRLTLQPRAKNAVASVSVRGGTPVIVGGRTSALSALKAGKTIEVTGVIKRRTHTLTASYSVIQD